MVGGPPLHGGARLGGTAELQLYPPIGYDGHILLPGAVTVWQTAVQSFLARVGLDQPRN